MSDTLRIEGGKPLSGTVQLGGDKSISHRALIFAGMASGESHVTGLNTGDDVSHTAQVLESLGVNIQNENIQSEGIDAWHEPSNQLDCGNSGTTLRLFLGALAGRPFQSTLMGDMSLSTRPMRRITDPLTRMGATFELTDNEYAPVTVSGGDLQGLEFDLQVASAQLKTALILAGLQANGVTVVRESQSSRDHTERMLQALDVSITAEEGETRVERGAIPAFDFQVPGDPSSAAFLIVAAALIPDSQIRIENVLLNPSRITYLDILKRMGLKAASEITKERLGEPVGYIEVTSSELKATEINEEEIAHCIDELPILAVAASFAEGTTNIGGATELRVKETDRIETMAATLTSFGIEVQTVADGWVITGGQEPHAATVTSFGDHRIALCAAVLGGVAGDSSEITQWSAAETSFPEFATLWNSLGGQCE